jgi:hypothetical protein
VSRFVISADDVASNGQFDRKYCENAFADTEASQNLGVEWTGENGDAEWLQNFSTARSKWSKMVQS